MTSSELTSPISFSSRNGSSFSRGELVLRPGVEIASVVPFVQLAGRLTVNAVDHPSPAYCRPLQECVSPTMHVLVVLHAQELGSSIEPAFYQPAIPREDGHISDRVDAARDVLTLREATLEDVELSLHLHGIPIDCIFDLLRGIRIEVAEPAAQIRRASHLPEQP